MNRTRRYKIEHQISRTEEQLKDYKDEDELSRHGMRAKGYLVGRLSLLYDLLEELDDNE